jgi:hypothetical protein
MILTDWFPGSVKPVRKGVYQREYIYGKAKLSMYCHWDGKRWLAGGQIVDGAEHHFPAPNQSLRWRGVLK